MTQIRPTTATVDLGRLRRNYAWLRQELGDGVKMLAPVKGDAYGHGLVEVARALDELGVDFFGVALVEEGKALRAAGVKAPILCLGGAGFDGAEDALEHDLTPMLFDLRTARELHEAARKRRRPVAVHLKVDTGMGRLGVTMGDWEPFLDRLANFPYLEVEGIATHFAEADTDPTFTQEQGRRFLEAVAQARQRHFIPRLIHASNSAAALTLPGLRLDMVRPGIALYGIAPAPGTGAALERVMQVRTRVLHVKNIPAGYGVSYGRRWTSERPTRLATLPVGYADGYPRALSNRAEVLIHGVRCPIRGTVCMDLIMVDVTDVPTQVRPGDPVELLGDTITAEELADHADTISYEILSSLSSRVPREHVEGA